MDRITVGIIGFGTVGTGVAKILLQEEKELENRAGLPVKLKYIADLDTTTDRGIKLPEGMLIPDANKLIEDPDVNTVVEVIGGENPAQTFIKKALSLGKNVVTSNKEVIAKHFVEFTELAKANNCTILYEAAVGGGIPVLHAVRNSLAANRIEKVFGIVNGTTNYKKKKMTSSGADFAATLKEAQKLGYAEADPKNDVEGFDVAYKLAILASLAFRCHVDYKEIYREGITKITAKDIADARKFGYTIKMAAIGINHGDSVELRVHPVMVENSHPLSSVNDVFNAIYIRGNSLGDSMLYGRGAGELPTASAVAGDIMNLAFRAKEGFQKDTDFNLKEIKILPREKCVTSFFISCLVNDESGVLAALASILSQKGVSIRSMQQVSAENNCAAITCITHPVEEGKMDNAIAEIKELPNVREISSIIRVGLGQ